MYVEGRYESPDDDKFIKFERSAAGLDIIMRKMSDNSLLGKITISTAEGIRRLRHRAMVCTET